MPTESRVIALDDVVWGEVHFLGHVFNDESIVFV